MSTTIKALLLTSITLLATIAGLGAGIMAKTDGATIPATLRAAAIGFGSSLTLFLAILTACILL